MKYAATRPFDDPEAAGRKLLDLANAVEAVQDGRIIHLEPVNYHFLYKEGANPTEYLAGLNLAIKRGWLWQHPSKTYVTFTPAGADRWQAIRSPDRTLNSASVHPKRQLQLMGSHS